jgi:hypothetical protein
MTTYLFFHRHRVMKALCVFMACVSLIACSSVEPRRDHDVLISVNEEAALTSYTSTRGVTASIPLTIRNTGTTSVWYNLCGNALERGGDAGWDEVWAQICTLPATQQSGGPPDGKEIAPGEEFTTEIQVSTWLGQGWTEPLNGQYRVRAGLFDERGELATETRTSSPFQFRIQIR